MRGLRRQLAEYLSARRALGTELREPGQALGHLVDALEHEGVEFITAERALRWATQRGDVQRATWVRRLGIVRGFAKWLHAIDPRTEIPPVRLLRAPRRRRTPYIFTNEEVGHLMAAASRLRTRTGLRPLAYVSLIGLLASTGLRPGEALTLDSQDVDLGEGVITIRDSKRGKSRLVPLEESTRVALEEYMRDRKRLCPRPQESAFLVSECGGRLLGSSARTTFALLGREVGHRPLLEGKRLGRGPRLQDLRHTFTTRRLMAWYRSGVDVAQRMPALSTYLGHAGMQHTYWYVQAVPELLALAAEHGAAVGGGRR
jgi:integrase